MRGITLAAAAALAGCSPQPAPSQPATEEARQEAGRPQTGLRQVPLTITSASGVHRFTVEVASTAEQQQHGMMFRTSLAPDRGMLFPYDQPQEVAFWMKNTLIPLDMIFIRADGTIARIATAIPHNQVPVPAGEPVVAVLEIAGGRAAELGIREGDKVEW